MLRTVMYDTGRAIISESNRHNTHPLQIARGVFLPAGHGKIISTVPRTGIVPGARSIYERDGGIEGKMNTIRDERFQK